MIIPFLIYISNERPTISVIITAFNRTEFLKECVVSVLNQDINPKEVEIIVVKNFANSEIDDFLNKRSVKAILSAECPIGRMLSLGVRNATGELISFLDDDDLFFSNKLSYVVTKFMTNKNLLYYHNSQMIINKQSEIVLNTKIERKTMNICLTNQTNMRTALMDFKRNKINLGSFFFNLSSITVRRSLLTDNLLYLERLDAHPDDFMFYLAIVQPNSKLCNEDAKLTYYRYHDSTTNVLTKNNYDGLLNKRIDLFVKSINSSKLFVEMVNDKTLNRYARSRLEHEQIMLDKLRGKTLEVLKGLIKLIFNRNLAVIEYDRKKRLKTYIGLCLYVSFYTFSKKLRFLQKFQKAHEEIQSLSRYS